MKIFISDRSFPVMERLVEMISAIERLDIVRSTDPASDPLEMIEALEPAAVLMGVGPGVIGQLSRLGKIKAGRTVPVVILITDEPSSLYREKLLGSGADFVFHRASEFDKVVGLLRGLNRGSLL